MKKKINRSKKIASRATKVKGNKKKESRNPYHVMNPFLIESICDNED